MTEALVDRDVGLRFFVHGIPAPKGSKRGYAVRRKDGTTGVVLAESAGEKLKTWNGQIHASVQAVAELNVPLDGPIAVQLDFRMPRPKSVPKKIIWHSRRPDVDKLARATLDPMSSVLFSDDAAICELFATKRYVAEGESPGVEVRIREAEW